MITAMKYNYYFDVMAENENVFHYTRTNYETIVSVRHYHNYKIRTCWCGIILFWVVWVLFQWRHNLKIDQNSILRRLFLFYET